jgi:hypothetical protein
MILNASSIVIVVPLVSLLNNAFAVTDGTGGCPILSSLLGQFLHVGDELVSILVPTRISGSTVMLAVLPGPEMESSEKSPPGSMAIVKSDEHWR